MKFNFLIAALLMLMPAAVFAQDYDTGSNGDNPLISYKFDNPELNFQRLKTKEAKVERKKNRLELESKKKGRYVVAASDIPDANPRNADIEYSAPLMISFDEKHLSGLVFDYRNSQNFQAFLLDKKYYYYVVFRDGDMTVVEKSPYKAKRKLGFIAPGIKVERNKIIFSVDGLEMGSANLARKLKTDKYGFFTNNESKLCALGGMFFSVTPYDDDEYSDEDDEDDDSDRRSRRRRSYDDDDD